jgi:hypothetical protein
MIWKQILKLTLLVGSLDIIAAFMNGYFRNGLMPATILKFIASGVFGEEAYSRGYDMMAIGLVFHFVIAFACTAIFFSVYPHIGFLKKSHLLNSFLIGLIAWSITTLVIMPLSKTATIPFNLLSAAIAIGILIICIGLPLSISAKKFYATD